MATLEDIRNEVVRLASEYPYNIYDPENRERGCHYNKGNNSLCPMEGCLFGIALRNLDLFHSDSGHYINVLIGTLTIEGEINYDLLNKFEKVQHLQDSKHTWDEAIKALDNIVE